ncbi:MAG: YdeI/OmpD-associated family protein [Bacteroidia bacterium]
MTKEKPIVKGTFLLEKFDGKGGWTFIRIPHADKPKTPFGFQRIKGSIDNYEIKRLSLMPMGNDLYMLPVKAEIRKLIGKKAGDQAYIELYIDRSEFETPEEFLICLHDEPAALQFYNKLSQSEKKFYVNWIYDAKKEETKVTRMAKAINKLAAGLKMYDKEPQ